MNRFSCWSPGLSKIWVAAVSDRIHLWMAPGPIGRHSRNGVKQASAGCWVGVMGIANQKAGPPCRVAVYQQSRLHSPGGAFQPAAARPGPPTPWRRFSLPACIPCLLGWFSSVERDWLAPTWCRQLPRSAGRSWPVSCQSSEAICAFQAAGMQTASRRQTSKPSEKNSSCRQVGWPLRGLADGKVFFKLASEPGHGELQGEGDFRLLLLIRLRKAGPMSDRNAVCVPARFHQREKG